MFANLYALNSMRLPERYRLRKCPTCGSQMKETTGSFLRAWRAQQNVGLREMARKLGLSAAYLSDVELNRRRATREIVAGYGLENGKEKR